MTFDKRESVLEINDVRPEAFHSHRVEGIRGCNKLAFALADECSSWPLSEEREVLDSILCYGLRSKPNPGGRPLQLRAPDDNASPQAYNDTTK